MEVAEFTVTEAAACRRRRRLSHREAGAGDGDRGATGRRPEVRADGGDRRGLEGEEVSRAGGEVPLPLVTVTSTEPVPAGETAVMEVAEITVTERLAWRRTRRRVTGEAGAGDGDRGPAAGGPKSGLMAVTVGARKANRSAGLVADGPLPLVTVTSTEPVPPGWWPAAEVAESTVTELAGVPPKVTAESPTKPVPVMVTEVPPALGPEVGADGGDGGQLKAKRSAGLVARCHCRW